MEIKQANFVTSSSKLDQCPDSKLPEFAFIGRSNVGKSSLINMLTNRNKLAMTSSTPGKTRTINHFVINNEWHLVDLPGYGYAQASKSLRRTFGLLIEKYVLNREQLTNLFVLIDSRLEPQKIDIAFIDWLGENQIPFAIVFTKTDKVKQNIVAKNLNLFKERLLSEWAELPPIFLTSSEKKRGKEDLLNYIEQIMLNIRK